MTDIEPGDVTAKILGRRKTDRVTYGMFALLVVQFGYHETRIRSAEAVAATEHAAVAAVTAATNERREDTRRSLDRIEAAIVELQKRHR